MRRLLCRLGLIAVLLWCAGCAAPGVSNGPSIPFLKNSKDEALRKQVEADSFPSAKQAGL
jgi:hypothetical protein